MVRPKDMGPADLAPNTAPPETFTPEDEAVVQRNAFYNSLPPEAKDAFLAELERAATEGASEEEAWRRAVVAVETTYPPEPLQAADAVAADAPLDGNL